MAEQSQGTSGAEPTPGAEPGAASGAPAQGESQGQEASTGGAGDELKKQLEAAQTANEELKKQLHGLTKKLKESGQQGKTLEQQLAELQEKEGQRAQREQELQAQLATRERADKVGKALEQVVSGIPEQHRKAAMAIAKGMDAKGLDADDPSSAVKALQESMKREFPVLFEQGSRIRAPVIPGANNGSSGVPVVGMFNTAGERIA